MKPPAHEAVLLTLAAHADELRAMGVGSLALFGSVARGEAHADSDVDVLIEIDRQRVAKFSLIDLAHVQNFLSDLLQREVQVTERNGVSDKFYERIGRDLRPAF